MYTQFGTATGMLLSINIRIYIVTSQLQKNCSYSRELIFYHLVSGMDFRQNLKKKTSLLFYNLSKKLKSHRVLIEFYGQKTDCLKTTTKIHYSCFEFHLFISKLLLIVKLIFITFMKIFDIYHCVSH